MRTFRTLGIAALAVGIAYACGFDTALREYLSVQFWLPFVKRPDQLAKPRANEPNTAFAGMLRDDGQSPLSKLRAAYRGASQENIGELAARALADKSLAARDREEAELIVAKLDLRSSELDPETAKAAKAKLEAFLRTAKTPELLSEARGWLGRAHYLLNDQTAAGKIYLDELSRAGTVLGRETLMNSLRMTYGYNGGAVLFENLEKYFDTPEHAAFAIHLATNPTWDRTSGLPERHPPYARVSELIQKHADLLRSEKGASALALLGMRAALRAGDPAAATRIAANVPAASPVRAEPDFLWMLASSHFLARRYGAAEQPLLRLFASRKASQDERSAAAYGLCGVYQKTGNRVEQIRFAAWLKSENMKREMYFGAGPYIEDMTVYLAVSGWDFGSLMDIEAPVESLRAFLEKYPKAPGAALVKYSLAVRLAREDRYDEASRIYSELHVPHRAARMTKLAELQRAIGDGGGTEGSHAGRYRMAEFLSANNERVYFNDRLWEFKQRYALSAPKDTRLTLAERNRQIALERRLRDDQEELWRAYKLLEPVVRETRDPVLKRKAAALAVRCVRLINTDRFGREEEIRAADIRMSSIR